MALKPTTIFSILVIPSDHFKNNNYLNKTDYARQYEYLETVRRSKLKQTHIGNCNYFVDPNWRILTWQIGHATELGEYIINDNRHPGLDIAITNNENQSMEDLLPAYLENLQKDIFSQGQNTLHYS